VRKFILIFCHDTNSSTKIISIMLLFLEQFVLDMYFLEEIAMRGGYFSNNTLVLVTCMRSAFASAGLNPDR